MKPKMATVDDKVIQKAVATAIAELRDRVVKDEVAKSVRAARKQIGVRVRAITGTMMKSPEFQKDLVRRVRESIVGGELDDILSSRDWSKFWSLVAKQTAKSVFRGFRK